MERLINLGTSSFGHQNNSLMRLYQITADRVRRGRIIAWMPAFSPELAIKKLETKATLERQMIDTNSAKVLELARSAFKKPINHHDNPKEYKGQGRRFVNSPEVPALVNILSNEYVKGYNDRLAYTGRQKAETRAKGSQDAHFFLMGWNVAQRKINAQKPKRTRKKSKVA